ncbi:MAG: hypothetical protein ABW069_06270 [Duganella sp.]
MKNNTPRYLHLAPEGELPVLEALDNFKAVLVVDVDVLETVRWDISRWLVESGCKVAVVWGQGAVAWGESIEDAHLEATDYEDVADEDVLIVTTHEDDDLSEAFWYARHRASHPAHELRDTVIVHIADAPRQDELEEEFNDA